MLRFVTAKARTIRITILSIEWSARRTKAGTSTGMDLTEYIVTYNEKQITSYADNDCVLSSERVIKIGRRRCRGIGDYNRLQIV
jgi:hypothetical protein